MKMKITFGLLCVLLPFGLSALANEPSAAEMIKRQLIFSTPLVWVGESEPLPADTEKLKTALAAFENGGTKSGFAALENYVDQNPSSAWTPALQMHLAEHARSIGRYSLALSHWEKAWAVTKSSAGKDGKAVASRAMAGWTSLLASLGRKAQLEELLKETKEKGLDRGPYADQIQASWEGLLTMKARPEVSFRCGTYSLARVVRELQRTRELDRKIHDLPSPDGGFKLSDLVEIAGTNGHRMIAVRRNPGGSIPVPAVVHWRLDHYAAILKKEGEFYFVNDPTFGGEQWISAETINEEASGNFLVAEGQIPNGFRELDTAEASLIRGKGCCNNPNDGEDDSGDDEGPDCPPPPPPTAGDGPGAGEGEDCPSTGNAEEESEYGMPRWRVSEPFISLWLHDVPLFYRQSSGKAFTLRLSYKSRGEDVGPSTPGFGPNWSCNWIGFLEDNSPVAGTIAYITNRLAGGGWAPFPVNGNVELRSGRTASGVSSSGISGGTARILSRRMKVNQYGSKLSFSAAPHRYFLTNRTDEFARSIKYQYTSNYVNFTPVMRLTTVTDMDGKQCALGYANSTYPNLITSVTNPYGAVVNFSYDGSGRLTDITDMAGMVSSFQYDGDKNVITNLHTPYGDTSFKYFAFTNTTTPDHAVLHRAIEITEPSTNKQLYAYHDEVVGDIGSFSPQDGYPQYRNSFHWNRQQYAAMTPTGKTNPLDPPAEDYRKASVKHWSHGETVGTVLQVLTAQAQAVPDGAAESQRAGQMTYTYEGQSGPWHTGPYRLSRISKVGGAVETETVFIRNQWGRPTNILYSRDAVLSGYTNQYNTDGRRLLRVWGPRGEQLRGYEYANVSVTNLLTAVTNAAGDVMRYAYDAGLRVTMLTNWSGLVTSNDYYPSGQFTGFLRSSVDLGFRTNSYTYTNGNIYTHTDELGLTVTNVWDDLNRLVCRVYPDGTTISNRYDTVKKLNLIGRKDRMNHWTYFDYNNLQQLTAVTNANNQVTLYDYCNCGSLDQITRLNGSSSEITTYTYDFAGRRTTASFPDGYTLNYSYDVYWPNTPWRAGGMRVTDSSGLIAHVEYGDYGEITAIGLSHDPDLSIDGYIFYRSFDHYGRAFSTTDRNSVTVTNGFDMLGRLTNRVTLDYYGHPSNTVTYAYTSRGLTNLTDELGEQTWFVYDEAGRLLSQTNANDEVLQFTYTPDDQIATLLDGKNQQTTWNYDEYGRVTNKLDAVREIFRYKYDQDDRLTNRWTAQKGDTFYSYDPIGNLTNVDYPGTIMDVTLQYDLLNRLTNVTDSVGATRFTHTQAGQLSSEDGPWVNDTVSYVYDSRRRVGMSIAQPNASAWTQSYAYDSYNRLSNVVSSAGEFVYSYWSGPGNTLPDRVQILGLPGYSTSHTYIQNFFDDLGRLTGTMLAKSSIINQHEYQLNEAHQRTRQTYYDGNSDGNTHYTDYVYDKIGQLKTTKGTDHAYDSMSGLYVDTPRLNEQFGYAYDKAWNLERRTNNALVQTFGVNNLNELTNATRSGTLTVAGLVSQLGANISSVSLTINSVPSGNADVYADGSWAESGVTLLNGNNTFVATATDTYGRTASDTISLSLPSTINFQYDYNGNLTNDGRRVFEYDYENQLTNVYVASAWRSEFKYDAFGRRRVRKEYTWQSSAWVLTNEVRYVYDGMLVVQERNPNNLALVSYTRGNDLSGSLQRAGGIGGLLARTDHSTLIAQPSTAHAYYHCDGNGNITAMVDTNGVLVAKYNYDPYGNLLGMSGPLAEANAFRFSSKEWCANAGLYYYGYRFYEPNLQRWINRDPIEEEGGINLFLGLANDAVNQVDPFGLDICVQNTPAVGGLHKRVSVGNPDKPETLYGQSFGMADRNDEMQGSLASFAGNPAAGKSGSGIVYNDDAPAIKTPRRFKTTPEEDKWAKNELMKELGNTGPYHWLTKNCRGYSDDKYDELVKKILKKRGTKPVVLRSPKDQANQ